MENKPILLDEIEPGSRFCFVLGKDEYNLCFREHYENPIYTNSHTLTYYRDKYGKVHSNWFVDGKKAFLLSLPRPPAHR